MQLNALVSLLKVSLCILIFTITVQGDEFSLTVVIPAGKTECFVHPIEKEKYFSFEIDYQVIAGGDVDINFYVRSPKGVQIISDRRRNDGMHRVQLDDPNSGRGEYTFCFENSMSFSMQSEKRVFFEFFLMDSAGQFLSGFDETVSVDADVLRTLGTQLANFQKVTTVVKDNLNKIERIQRQYSSLELADRTALESSFEMINFWSTVHLGVMLFSVAVQVYMVRCLFEDDSKVGRLLRKGRLND